MGRADYERVPEEMWSRDGKLFPLPVTLAAGRDDGADAAFGAVVNDNDFVKLAGGGLPFERAEASVEPRSVIPVGHDHRHEEVGAVL